MEGGLVSTGVAKENKEQLRLVLELTGKQLTLL